MFVVTACCVGRIQHCAGSAYQTQQTQAPFILEQESVRQTSESCNLESQRCMTVLHIQERIPPFALLGISVFAIDKGEVEQ